MVDHNSAVALQKDFRWACDRMNIIQKFECNTKSFDPQA